MPNFENAFKTVCELVEDFKENEARYLSPQYQEAEVRRDYIDKLLEALGWDVYHRTQKNPYAQEVKVEKGVNVGKAQKRADYAFYISPEYRQPKFFVEAKKPSRNLKNADDYFQTIRYGWNANTPVAVLTDFQEFHVLDCRYKPNIANVLSNPNHKSYVYTDFLDKEKFGEIYYLFARNHVAENSLAKYSEGFEKIKGKAKSSLKGSLQAIDDDFLGYIDELRETLAKAFKKNDAKLSSEELTEATQRTVDRIVFIRFLEDKLIEPEYHISAIAEKGNAWCDFISLCRKLDAKYNGIVFKKHFIDEQTFQGPEQSTFKKICDEISYLNSPYDFNAIPIHILGSIYERFLGKVVNATAQRVKVEEKPEVRKAGGVYYTPKYIVDYIVDNTVGKIIRNENDKQGSASIPACEKEKSSNLEDCPTLPSGKTPAEISKLRFADIACGSGSFLIGVFETLLKYHTEYYQSHPEQAKKDGCINKEGQWILSIKQKQNILLNNIYGVDIDHQAVEVTQLSLALKMLEDESLATANEMQVLFHEKILPDLSKNIVCGNSLIGTDILEGRMFASDEERKLNPMDFEKRFPHVFAVSTAPNLSFPSQGSITNPANPSSSITVIPAKAGIQSNNGFDAIVGNPPYGFRQIYSEEIKLYLKKNYEASKGSYENYILFYEKSLKLLRKGALHGFIVPVTWLTIPSAKSLRKLVLDNYSILKISWLPEHVFKNAQVNTLISIIKKIESDNTEICIYENDNLYNIPKVRIITTQSKFVKDDYYISIFENNKDLEIIQKIINVSIDLDKLSKPCSGYNPYEVGKGIAPNGGTHTKETVKNKPYHSNYRIDDAWKPEIIGRNLSRYYINNKNDRWIKYGNWLAASRNPENFLGKRILVQEITGGKDRRIIAAYCDYEIYYSRDIIPIKVEFTLYDPLYLLAILNSKMITWFHHKRSPKSQKALFPKVLVSDLAKIPIRNIDLQSESEKQSHDRIVSLVTQILESKKLLHSAKTERDKTYYENKCADLDHAIDSEVYKLYDLTDDEIKIVEGKQ